MDEPTDLDLIVGHPFTPAWWHDAWPGLCGHVGPDGWPCGFTAEEHAERLEGATEGGEAIES